MRAVRTVLGVVGVLSYPLVVYFGMQRFSPRTLALTLGVLALGGAIVRSRHVGREHLAVVLRVPLVVLVLASLGAVLEDARAVLAMPIFVNLALLHQFGSSLRSVPIIERFARMVDSELSPAQVRYCRTVTVVWCGFFVLNAVVVLVLALLGETALWAIYTGLVSYVLMGILGAAEYLVRKRKFQKFDDHLLDRVLARVLGPATSRGG